MDSPEPEMRYLLIVASLFVGLSMVIEGQSSFFAPVWSTTKAIAPIWVWGVLFLTGSLFTAASMWVNNKWVNAFALLGAATTFALFGGAALFEGATSPRASIVNGVMFMTVAVGAMVGVRREVHRADAD